MDAHSARQRKKWRRAAEMCRAANIFYHLCAEKVYLVTGCPSCPAVRDRPVAEGLRDIAHEETVKDMNVILLTAIGVGGSTAIGSLLGYCVKNVSHRVSDTVIGLCAGIMLAASVMGLIEPAFELAPRWSDVWVPCVGVAMGVLLVGVLDRLTPHLHTITGIDPEAHHHNQHIDRVLLLVLAIALHKLPEGLAAGVGFGGEDISDAVNVAIAISLQNVPEGMVIISPLLLAGVSHIRTFLIAIAIGMLEVAGVFMGYYLGSLSASVLPFMLALSGGAMLYVVSDEMIPESHAHGYQKQAPYALITGFVLMLLIDWM